MLTGVGNRALPKNLEGGNWLGWVELIKRSPKFELVAVHDPADSSLDRIVERAYLQREQTFQDLDLMLRSVEADGLLIANPAEFHASAIDKAIAHNLHVLVEKPFVTVVEQGRELVAAAARKGLVVAVVQNWRTKDVGQAMYHAVQEGRLGQVGHIFFRYVRDRENPNYPAYIFEEEFPLLYAMGIHHLDIFQYVLKDPIVRVRGNSFKPPWSMYKSDTGLNLYLETKGGVSIVYTGTISARNVSMPQESILIEGEKGALYNESPWLEPPLWFLPREKGDKVDLTENVADSSTPGQYNISDICILNDFHRAVGESDKPICSAAEGLSVVTLLEAAKEACQTGKTISLT